MTAVGTRNTIYIYIYWAFTKNAFYTQDFCLFKKSGKSRDLGPGKSCFKIKLSQNILIIHFI